MLRKLSQFALVAVLSTAVVTPETAAAQSTEGEQVAASPKGLIGLGMIGAELGFAIPALAGMDDLWAYIVFPIVGAAGGAVAGHFAIDNNDKPKAAVAMLAVGIALVVPTLVITLIGTAYDPEDEGTVEDDESQEPPPAPTTSTMTSANRARDRVARAGGGLLRLAEGQLLMGMPGLSLVPRYSADELARFGGTQSSEVHLSVLSGAF